MSRSSPKQPAPPAAALPEVFLPYQQRLWRAIDTHSIVVSEKGRRTGYSWALGAVAASTAASTRDAGGMDVLYMGYEKEMTREFMDYVAEFAKLFESMAGGVQESVFQDPDHPDRDIQVFRIKFASGFEVVALPSIARALRGKQGLVILDEAAFMDDLDGVIKAALALQIWGGKLIVNSTHNSDTNVFATLVNDIRAGRQEGIVLRTTFADAVAEGLYRRVCLRTKQPWSIEAEQAWVAKIERTYRANADEELGAIPNPSTGAYIPRVIVEARMVPAPVLRWEMQSAFGNWAEHIRRAEAKSWCEEHLLPVLLGLPADRRHVLGMDFARKGDLSVIWPLCVGADMVRRTPFTVELRNIPYTQQQQVLFYVIERLPRFGGAWMDATGNGGYLAEVTQQRFGESIVAVMMSELWYREHMPPLKAAFEDAMIEIPRDDDTGEDFSQLKIVRGVGRIPDATLNADGKRRHGDAAIAACLAYAASRAEHEAYGYQPAPLDRLDLVVSRPVWSNVARDFDEDHAPPERGIMPASSGGLLHGR